MTPKLYTASNLAPSAEEFVQLRTQIGWGEMDLALAQASLDNSLYHIVIRMEDQLVGMGRVVGDGYMYFYVQDVVVAPDFQRLGLGYQLMDHIEAYLAQTAKIGATIGLLAAKGKEGFYQKFGYQQRDGAQLGLGMCKFITEHNL